MASPTEQTHPRSCCWQRKQRKPNPNTVYTEQKQNTLQYCVYQKKKKKNPIQSLCTKTKPKKPQYSLIVAIACSSSSSSQLTPRRCCCSLARPSSSSLIAHHSPLIANGRSQIALLWCLVFGARRSQIPPSRYFSPSQSLSLSLFISLKV